MRQLAASALRSMGEAAAQPEVVAALLQALLADARSGVSWKAADALSALMSRGWRIFKNGAREYRAQRATVLASLPPPYEALS